MVQRFDSTPQALLTLFEVATTEGWIETMLAAVDAVAVDAQPRRDHAPGWILFFVCFMLFGSLLVLNLFVGVLLENFQRKRNAVNEENSPFGAGSIFATEAQREWVKATERTLRAVRGSRPMIALDRALTGLDDSPLLAPCERVRRGIARGLTLLRVGAKRIVVSRAFEVGVLVAVVVNVALMASEHVGQPDAFTRVSQCLSLSFAVLFTAEACVKLFALRWDYFGVRPPGGSFMPDAWNCFDFAIVVGTDASLVARAATGDDSSVGALAMVARACRVARFLRLARGYGGMRRLFDTLLVTLPGFVNVGGLLLLLFFIYAAVGMQLFAKVGYHGAVTPHAHFRRIDTALLTLLRFATGENFNGFAHGHGAHPRRG